MIDAGCAPLDNIIDDGCALWGIVFLICRKGLYHGVYVFTILGGQSNKGYTGTMYPFP